MGGVPANRINPLNFNQRAPNPSGLCQSYGKEKTGIWIVCRDFNAIVPHLPKNLYLD
jgi:hypothetical protein